MPSKVIRFDNSLILKGSRILVFYELGIVTVLTLTNFMFYTGTIQVKAGGNN